MTYLEILGQSNGLTDPALHDVTRAALAVAVFLLVGLALSLAASTTGVPLTAAAPIQDWHGNVAASGWAY